MKIYNLYFPPEEDVSSNQISPRAQFSLENVFPVIIICRVRSKIAWRFTLLNKNIERGLIYNRFKCQCILFHLHEILLVISYRHQNRGDILHHYDLLKTGGYFIVVNFHKKLYASNKQKLQTQPRRKGYCTTIKFIHEHFAPKDCRKCFPGNK